MIQRCCISAVVAVIKVYQLVISPLLPSHCRFHPTCSEFAILALRKHGFLSGSVKACRRILRCHPFHPGGYDPA
ncbi:MAG: membrane protein insertion efficiency factor YidD [Candidatus Latescibacteria bacterium]|nr:membrane protein insertion efficiency factor YidD [Candidatus Latescibacterota bacterium]